MPNSVMANPIPQYVFDFDTDSCHLGYDSDSYSDSGTIFGDPLLFMKYSYFILRLRHTFLLRHYLIQGLLKSCFQFIMSTLSEMEVALLTNICSVVSLQSYIKKMLKEPTQLFKQCNGFGSNIVWVLCAPNQRFWHLAS